MQVPAVAGWQRSSYLPRTLGSFPPRAAGDSSVPWWQGDCPLFLCQACSVPGGTGVEPRDGRLLPGGPAWNPEMVAGCRGVRRGTPLWLLVAGWSSVEPRYGCWLPWGTAWNPAMVAGCRGVRRGTPLTPLSDASRLV